MYSNSFENSQFSRHQSNEAFSQVRRERVTDFLAQGLLPEFNSCSNCPLTFLCGAVLKPLFDEQGSINRANAGLVNAHGITVSSDGLTACPKKLVETAVAKVSDGSFWVESNDALDDYETLQVGQALMNSVEAIKGRLSGGQYI